MFVMNFGKKEIHTKVAPNSSMFQLYLTDGGSLPVALSGLYSSVREAKTAVIIHLGKHPVGKFVKADKSGKTNGSK